MGSYEKLKIRDLVTKISLENGVENWLGRERGGRMTEVDTGNVTLNVWLPL